MKTLFICKRNHSYGSNSYFKKCSGLYNSTKFVADAIGGKVVEVVDNNDIDREVALHKPDIVIIEALWVVPEKFDILKNLHPSVRWFIHLHSNIPFLASEGIAVNWLYAYAAKSVGIICNSEDAYHSIRELLGPKTTVFLPNVYPLKNFRKIRPKNNAKFINIGCFGAIRPMKNQLIQAIAALSYAKKHKKFLYFHVNTTRVETGGESTLKNLLALFEQNKQYGMLLEHEWLTHQEFLVLIAGMHISLQVSMSETFNIVTADAVASGIPVVGSRYIPWLPSLSCASTESAADIEHKISMALKFRYLAWFNQFKLRNYSSKSTELWKTWLRSKKC